jgi:electron transport complex protein RnfG
VSKLERNTVHSTTKTSGGLKNANLVQAWLVLLLALFFGSALAAVQVQLSGKIAENKRNETLARVPGLIWGNADSPADPDTIQITPGTVKVEKAGKPTLLNIYRVAQKDQVAGWVIKAGGQGYADKLELLIGVDADLKRISGIFVLEQKETPGLGNKIIFPEWRDQFIGKKTDSPLEVIKSGKKTPHTIDAITGATISSRAVTTIVNTTIDSLKGQLDASGNRFSGRPTS